MRTDWRSCDPSTARRRLTSHLPVVRVRCRNRIGAARQLPEFVRNVNEDGVGEGCGLLVVEKETILTVLPTSTSPRMDVNPSTPIDRPLSLSYPNLCQPIFPSSPTHAASSAMPHERSLTVVLGSFGYLLCSGHTSPLPVVFLKDAGTHAHRKVDL